jgi:nanoRNase/pAp phosphatase (c-di-AMP/oligoRNAs hydrolase)
MGKDEKNATDQTAGGKLIRLMEAHRGERHIIVVQDFPDPDALSSALAHQMAAARFEIESVIVYQGRISHQQNVALVRLANIQLTRFEEVVDLKSFDGSVFVDSQGTTAGAVTEALAAAGVPPLVVVDHHEDQGMLEPEFRDIRRTMGATASMYAEYLREGLLELDPSSTDHVKLATALLHGIITDTHGFIYADGADFAAAAFLSRFRDADMLNEIMHQARSRQTMNLTQRALSERKVVESYAISGLGYVRAEDRDAIPQAADFLLTEENVHTAIVYGIVVGDDRDEAVVGSLRTSKITVDPDAFIKEVFGRDASGNYFGGGKLSAGGFRIPVGFLSGGSQDKYQESKWTVFNEKIRQKIFAKIGHDDGQES